MKSRVIFERLLDGGYIVGLEVKNPSDMIVTMAALQDWKETAKDVFGEVGYRMVSDKPEYGSGEAMSVKMKMRRS